jgi:protein O-mannosyl-transferase
MGNTKKKKIKQISKQQVKKNTSYFSWSIIAMLGITAIAFLPSLSNQFTNLDDPGYVLENELAKSLSGNNIKAIFSQFVLGNYHPITILSYAFNFSFSKLTPFGYILTNLIFHLINVYLVYIVTKKLFKNNNIAFITAFIFGIHPMHVESVTWIAGRKDMLYTFFYLFGIYYYLKFTESTNSLKSQVINYILILLFFVLSLFSKAVAVTLPVVFFLIDYMLKRKLSLRLILEKIPFIILSVIIGIVAINAQKTSGAIVDTPIFSFLQSIIIASYSAMFYIFRFIFPINLSVFYPYPETIPYSLPLIYYISFALIIVLLISIFLLIKKNRILVFGTMFFFITVALVLQFISVGSAVAADRYTYVPYIGLSIIVGYFFNKVQNGDVKSLLSYKNVIKYIGIVVLLVFSYITFNQTKVWANSGTLYTKTIKNYPNVPIAYNNRGNYYSLNEKYDSAFNDYCMAINTNKNYQNAYLNRANIYGIQGKYKESVDDYTIAISLNPKDFMAYFNRSLTYSKMGLNEDALKDCEKAGKLRPSSPEVMVNKADILLNLNRNNEAIECYNKYLTLNINKGITLYNIGKAYYNLGNYQKSIDYFNEALSNNLNDESIYFTLSLTYKNLKNYSKALEYALIFKNKGNNLEPGYLEELETIVKGKK